MTWLSWLIVIVPMVGVLWAAFYSRRYVRGVADFLAAGDTHAIDAADHRLLAVEDAVDHGVEEVHVLAVLVRPLRVVGGIFGGVAAGAERLVAGAGQHHAANAGVVPGQLEECLGEIRLHGAAECVHPLRAVQPDDDHALDHFV